MTVPSKDIKALRRWLLVAAISFLLVTPLDLAVSQHPDAEAHAERGLRLARAGRLEDAETELRMAAEQAPANAQILASLGTVLAMEKKLEASSEIFQRVLKISPNDLTARRYLAANLWQLQRFVDAKKHLAIILKAKPEDAEARLLMGMVAENMKDYATAARMLASVPQQVRQRPESLAALARSYYHLGQKENARTTLTQLSGPQAVFLGAQIADERQDYGTAEKLLGSIQSTFPDP
ncbi:MAG TPA: tetratricopeptide repeat protein, partial [Terriglobales bacterium]